MDSRVVSFFGDLAYSSERLGMEVEVGGLAHCNLEAPIFSEAALDKLESWKVGPHLRQNGLLFSDEQFRKFSFSLANNHMMDFGDFGLTSTLNFLVDHKKAGAGLNLSDARLPIIFPLGTRTLGIISCADIFFGYATSSRAGIASISPVDDWVGSLVEKLREDDVIPIISFHGGLEDWMIPSRVIRSLFHTWIDKGAELIIGHHSHIPMPTETYKGKKIYFGLGNFIVEPSRWEAYHPMALTSIQVDLTEGEDGIDVSHKFIKLSRSREFNDLRVAYLPAEQSELLDKHSDKVAALISDEESYSEVLELISEHYVKKFSRKQLILGSSGLYLRTFLKTLYSKNSKYGGRLRQGFGPHHQDIFGPLATAELMSIFDQEKNAKFSKSRMKSLNKTWNLF